MVKHLLSDTTKNSKAGEMLSDILLPVIYNYLIYNNIPPLKEVIEADNGKDMLVRLRIIYIYIILSVANIGNPFGNCK